MKKIYAYGLMLVAAINIGFYYGLILPRKAQADSILKEIEVKRQEVGGTQSFFSSALLAGDIKRFHDMLPQKSKMTTIIRELNDLARRASLSIHDISYEAKKNGASAIFPFSFSFPVEGKYLNIKNFIYQLETSRRLITIDDLSLEKASGQENIRLKIKISVYLKS